MKEYYDKELSTLLRESYPRPEHDAAFTRRVLRSLPARKSLLIRVLEFVASPWFLWLVIVALCIVFRSRIMECAAICVRSISSATLPDSDTLSMMSVSLAVFAFMLVTLWREAEE